MYKKLIISLLNLGLKIRHWYDCKEEELRKTSRIPLKSSYENEYSQPGKCKVIGKLKLHKN